MGKTSEERHESRLNEIYKFPPTFASSLSKFL
jgi:hypothetical protein